MKDPVTIKLIECSNFGITIDTGTIQSSGCKELLLLSKNKSRDRPLMAQARQRSRASASQKGFDYSANTNKFTGQVSVS
jgi:hypothetical protein